MLQNKWLSLLHHVQDDHDGSWGQCNHDLPLLELPTNRHGDVLPWFKADEPAMEALRKVVMDPKWLQTMRFYVNFRYIVYIHVYTYMYIEYYHVNTTCASVYMCTKLACTCTEVHVPFVTCILSAGTQVLLSPFIT